MSIEEDILSRVDTVKISVAASIAEVDLSTLNGVAFVDLQPGDMTRYLILIARVPVGVDVGARYVVALINNSGQCYPWDGQHTHYSYFAAKWQTDNHTAVVLSTLLNQIAELFDA